MLEQFCDDFLAIVPLQLPELLDKRKMEKPVKYDDYVLLTFQLNTPFTIEEVMDMLEDEMEMIILYHHIPKPSYGVRAQLLCLFQPLFWTDVQGKRLHR